MHAFKRRELMVEWMVGQQFASIQEMAGKFNVSVMTVRRDLSRLAEAGLVERLPGGARINQRDEETPFAVKQHLYAREKLAVAARAVDLVKPGMVVALSAGTTTWTIAHMMRPAAGVVCLTNSTNVAIELHRNQFTQIVLSGGNFRTPSDALVGPIAERSVRELNSDLLFLGVHALDPATGFSSPNVAEAVIDQALIANTKKVVVVVADVRKWGSRALARIAPLNAADLIITMDGVPEATIQTVCNLGVEVWRVATNVVEAKDEERYTGSVL